MDWPNTLAVSDRMIVCSAGLSVMQVIPPCPARSSPSSSESQVWNLTNNTPAGYWPTTACIAGITGSAEATLPAVDRNRGSDTQPQAVTSTTEQRYGAINELLYLCHENCTNRAVDPTIGLNLCPDCGKRYKPPGERGFFGLPWGWISAGFWAALF